MVPDHIERRRFWGRMLIAMFPVIVLGFVALISLRSDVRHIQDDLVNKANRETVEIQNRAVLQAIEDLRTDIREFRRVVTKP